MLWKEVKTWATSHGYKVDRIKIDGTKQSYNYFWHELSNPNNAGQAQSTLDLAKDIYNDITDSKFVEYQKSYNREGDIYIQNPFK